MRPSRFRTAGLAVLAGTLLLGTPAVGMAATADYPSDEAKPDIVRVDEGYERFWVSDGKNDLHGTVKDPKTLARDDSLIVWINNHATPEQQRRAMQDSEYQNKTNTSYDQSITIGEALGSKLGPLYVQGRQDGSLPLTTALINSSDGTTGAYVDTGDAKKRYSHPRPFLPADPKAAPKPGDEPACAPEKVNASSLASERAGKPYADASGTLNIKRVPDFTDSSKKYSPNDVDLSAQYGKKSLCTGGSYPSGHTTTAYQAGITLATLVPELAPELLTRASEAGNNRIVLGVHYPLDIMGGRMNGEAALAARWSDAKFREEKLEPARKELVGYLEKKCGGKLAACIAQGKGYSDNPYGGKALPGGSPQIVTDRASAVKVYKERMTYGFEQVENGGQKPSVPAGAENLLLTTFPTLNDAQRTSVLAQTEIDSGYPLDQTGTAGGSWQRLNLAAATSAVVKVQPDGSVKVVKTGGKACVIK
ncbi:acid phosphatase [Pseudonocardia phyllosphaerae]|uniref:acid phosphatase n=1 Tax=Pseudonocardia phyllosphaerae TaxID=3390502 RepID=UPI00397CB479